MTSESLTPVATSASIAPVAPAAPVAEAHPRPARMTAMGVLASLFPATLGALVLACAIWFAVRPGLAPLASALGVLYVLPLAVYRLHARFYPLREAPSYLVGGVYSPWFGSHQIQIVYIAFPALETALRLVPGLYSAWLRLWGSRVGKGIYWTPRVEIVDRGLVDIGDRVIFGHGCGVISHVIRPTKDNLLLYVRRVKIGDAAFIGAGSYLAPGAVVEPGAIVPAATHVYPRQTVRA